MKRRLWAVAVTILVAVQSTVVSADDQAASGVEAATITIDEVAVGFDGYFKVGRWSPLVVSVTTSRRMRVRLIIEVSDPDGSLTSLPGDVIALPSAGAHELPGVFKSGRVESSLRVVIREETDQPVDLADRQLHVSSGPDAELRAALTHALPLVATLGGPAGFDDVEKQDDSAKSTSTADEVDSSMWLRVAALDGFEQIPGAAVGLDSLDALVIAGKYDVGADRNEAIRGWVQAGGQLILSVGANIDGYTQSPLSKWVPVGVAGRSNLRALTGLETYSGKSERIDLLRVRSVPAARLRRFAGVVVVREIDGPVLVHVPYGFGRVTFVGLDLDRAPLSDWKGIANVGRRIIFGQGDRTLSDARKGRTSLAHSGITDVATQIFATQDYFPQVRRISMWMVMGLLVVYLLVVGPLDYLLVHRLFRKPELTWVTLPLIVVIAGGLAVWGARATNGNRVCVNQIDLVDIDVESQTMRSRSWMTVFSPQTARYHVHVNPLPLDGDRASSTADTAAEAAAADDMRISWNGVPENSYGGMYRRGGFEIGRSAYAFAENASAIENLPIPIWSTKSLSASWRSDVPNLVESDLSGTASSGLSGSIEHHLPVPLEDWVLAFGRMAYMPLPNKFNQKAELLQPNRPQRFSPNAVGLKRRDLKGFLTGLRRTSEVAADSLREQILIETDEYDPLQRDPARIMQVLTFYTRAGGSSYTSLDNNELRSLDLSRLLDLKRAVLFGKLASPAAELELDGAVVASDRRKTFVRIVLPVEERDATYQSLSGLDRRSNAQPPGDQRPNSNDVE